MAYLEVLGTLNSCNPQVFCSQSSTPTSTSTKGDENNKLQNWARSNGDILDCLPYIQIVMANLYLFDFSNVVGIPCSVKAGRGNVY